MTRILRRWVLFALLLSLVGSATAEPLKQAHVEAELVSARQALIPGQTQWLALRLKMDPHWHVYWRNPGTAGYPPQLKWTLPPGLQAGPVHYPTPIRAEVSGLLSYVYEGEVFLPVALEVAKDGLPDKVVLKAHVRWLACEKSCMPGEGDVELTLPVATAAEPSKYQAAIDEARNRLPLTQGIQALNLGPAPDGKVDLTFVVATEGGVDKAEFFPYEQNVIDDAAPQPFQPQGAGGSLRLTLDKTASPTPGPGSPTPLSLQGLLVVTQSGKTLPFDVNVTLGATGAAPTPVAASPTPAAAPPAPPTSLWQSLIGAFIGGMILNLMPCVFPVLSIKIMGLVQHNDPQHKPHIHGWMFTAGVLACFWLVAGSLLLLRASGQKLGWGFQLQSPLFVASMAVLFYLIGLNLFGLFEVGESLVQLGSYAEGKTGYSESFWSGALATLVATPCSAPFMGAAVGYALTQPPYTSMLIFTCLGLGMASPYVLLTTYPGLLRFLPRPGAWMETFKQLMGFPMMATVVWFAYILGAQTGTEGMAMMMMAFVFLGLAAWVLGRWGWDPESETRRRGARFGSLILGLATMGALLWGLTTVTPAPASAQASPNGEGIAWQPYTPAAVAEARRQGKPVFIDFTAEWCLSCKVNEKVGLRNAAVQERFRQLGVVPFKADWTNRDATISEALAAFGRSGVPLYVYYGKGQEARVLPEVITPQIVLDVLN